LFKNYYDELKNNFIILLKNSNIKNKIIQVNKKENDDKNVKLFLNTPFIQLNKKYKSIKIT